MVIFRAPLAHTSKADAFRGRHAIRMPTSEDEYEDDELECYIEKRPVPVREARRPKPVVKREGFLREESSTPLLIHPFIVEPLPHPPKAPSDMTYDSKPMELLEKNLKTMSLATETRSVAAEKEQERLKTEIKEAFDEAHSPKAHIELEGMMKTSFLASSASFRERIQSIREARRVEEAEAKERIKASLAAQKAAAAAPKPVEPAKPVEREVVAPAPKPAPVAKAEAPAPAPQKQQPVPAAEIDEGVCEMPLTRDRANMTLQQAERIFASVAVINAATDDEAKKRKMTLKLEINKRMGQIAQSGNQVFLVIRELLTLANDSWKNGGQDWLHYAVNIMATKLIEQAENQISIHTPSAFAFAQVAVELLASIPAFGDVLMALLIRKCPYIIPRYPPRLPGQSETEYKISLGYKAVGQGVEADEGMYVERMCGIIALFAAIVQSEPLRPNQKNPFDISYGWVWLSAILNLQPRPVTAYLVAAYLDIAGYGMWLRYRETFLSFIEYINDVYIPMIPDSSVAPRTRLKLFVEGALKRDKEGGSLLVEPEGRRIPGINYELRDNPAATAARRNSQTASTVSSQSQRPSGAAGRPNFAPRHYKAEDDFGEQGRRPSTSGRPPANGRPSFAPNHYKPEDDFGEQGKRTPTPGRPAFPPTAGRGKKKSGRGGW